MSDLATDIARLRELTKPPRITPAEGMPPVTLVSGNVELAEALAISFRIALPLAAALTAAAEREETALSLLDSVRRDVTRLETLLADAQQDIRAAAERETALREAGKALVEALDACKPGIDSAFTMSAVHGCPYDGPTYGVQLEALRTALEGSRA